MALAAAPAAPRYRTGGPRRTIEVEQHELVGAFMDADSLAAEALFANGAAVQLLRRLPAGAAVEQAILATRDAQDALKALRTRVQTYSGRFDRNPLT